MNTPTTAPALSLTELSAELTNARVLAVVTLARIEDAEPLLKALTDGGITAIELALRTPASIEALTRFRQLAPGLLLGAGTVLSPEQADEARAAGADFALAPGLDAATVRHCADIGMPFVPGVATPSEVQAAVALGCRLLKLFPAETMGGIKGLQTLASPFLHLGISYIPLGGISANTATNWLASPLVAAIGGSWIAPRELIAKRDWDEINRRASHASSLAADMRTG